MKITYAFVIKKAYGKRVMWENILKHLTNEQKQFILTSLQEDYVPISDAVAETCADTYADMLVSGALKTKDGQMDRQVLNKSKKNFFLFIEEKNFEAVLPIIEQINTLKEKYHNIRFSGVH